MSLEIDYRAAGSQFRRAAWKKKREKTLREIKRYREIRASNIVERSYSVGEALRDYSGQKVHLVLDGGIACKQKALYDLNTTVDINEVSCKYCLNGDPRAKVSGIAPWRGLSVGPDGYSMPVNEGGDVDY